MNRFSYQQDLEDVAEALSDLMADLEDVREDAQDALDEGENAAAADIDRMDAALALLAQAADLLDGESQP